MYKRADGVLRSRFFTYIFSNKRYRFECFEKQAVESLKEFYTPVFHEMRIIKRDINSYKKEELLSNFIKKYVSKDTQLYKSYNANLIDLFYDLDETFSEYNLKKEKYVWEKTLSIFNDIYYLVKKEYWDIQKSLYKQYPWYKKLNAKSYIFRFIMDLSTLFYDTVQFVVVTWLSILYIIFFNKITGKNNAPNFIKENFKNINLLIFALFVFALVVRLPYYFVVMDYKKKNKITKKINLIILDKLNIKFEKFNRKERIKNIKNSISK